MVMNKKNRIKITWSIEEELVKRVKHKAVDMDTDASSIVEDALRKLFLENK
jgi:predicted transcriptional regulator